jgi:tetratricopeptide (TPR) repeat protein
MLCVLALAAVGFAQNKGNAQISGTVVDEQGQPLQDVQVRAARLGAGDKEPISAKTNKKGEWTLKKLAPGEWTIEFSKEGAGLEVKTVKVKVAEGEQPAPVAVTLGKYVDPNVDLQTQAQKASELFDKKQFADARKIYEDLLAKYPSVFQLHPMIARTYAAENNYSKAIDEMKIAVDKDPTNADNRMLLGELLLEQGDKEEGRKLIEGTDLSQVKDPYPFLNVAINLINTKQPEEAITLLDKVLTRFPTQAEIYYYRGRANLAAQKIDAAKADLEKYVSMAPPDAKEVADAKNILAQLNKK